MTVKERLQHIIENLYLTESALFAALCTHELKENTSMACAIRSGRGYIEYNPDALADTDNVALSQFLRTELVRILLKHPYGRQPENCSADVVTAASDCVVSNNYKEIDRIKLAKAANFRLPKGESFEWYAHHIKIRCTQSQMDQSALWKEDQLQEESINVLIKSTSDWGTLPNTIVEKIVASAKPKIDYRRAFEGFRSSIASSHRRLTRMRPNRRTEFEQMGSIYDSLAKILVAVDVSGSVSDSTLGVFYSLINRFFKYGIKKMDVVQFDAALGEVTPFKHAKREIEVCGRGGTSFQPVIDFVSKSKYDGVVILTDGMASAPEIPQNMRTHILWIADSEKNFNYSKEWMCALPRSRACWIKL